MSQAIRKFGYELEYASGAEDMVRTLHSNGVIGMDYLHDYHCRCEMCVFVPQRIYSEASDRDVMTPPRDIRAQRDSTANGEFITRPIEDWDDFTEITASLVNAATQAGATVNSRCGLHVHVDTSDDGPQGELDRYGRPANGTMEQTRLLRCRTVPAAYLAFERYFTEIVAPGASIRKREMNQTLMEASRQWVANGWDRTNNWMDMGRGAVDDMLAQVIASDRHVDLNWSRNHRTWEFRCFNATNSAWRIELACRLATSFVEAAPQLREMIESTVRGSKYWPEGCDSPWGEIVRPAWSELPAPHPTKRPIIPMHEFIDCLCAIDPDLRPLIERQANYMRARFAKEIEVAA